MFYKEYKSIQNKKKLIVYIHLSKFRYFDAKKVLQIIIFIFLFSKVDKIYSIFNNSDNTYNCNKLHLFQVFKPYITIVSFISILIKNFITIFYLLV